MTLSKQTLELLAKWKDLYPDPYKLIEEAVFEFDIHLSYGIKPSEIKDYDKIVGGLNSRLDKLKVKTEDI
jgi:hypothetical protein